MIEKLEENIHKGIEPKYDLTSAPSNYVLMAKINELVEAVNKLEKRLEPEED
jgi:hypothetical protein